MKRIFRTKKGKKNDKFTMVSNDLLNSDLSADSIYVMIQVLKKPDYWKFYIKKFSVEIKFGERRLRTALDELEKNGYCQRNKISKREVEFTFFESKILNPELKNTNVIDVCNEVVSVAKCSFDSSDLQY